MARRSSHRSPAVAARPRGTDLLPELLREPAQRFWDQFQARARDEGVRVPSDPAFLDALFRVWACSEFVAGSCAREPALLADLLDTGDLLRDYAAGDYPGRLVSQLRHVRDDAQLAEALRGVRRREMVRIVWRDLAGWAGLEETLRDLSWLAEACLNAALAKLSAWMRRDLGSPRSATGAGQSLIVLGMGKLGAGELNVSSDIDLIFTYPEEGATRKHGGISSEEYFTRLGRRLIQVIGEPTAGGFVFRVDMRLRPYGDSGPLVLSFDALEEYYQSQGREWERYALIKARVVAGDRAAGKSLLQLLHPFIYRRYLDFGAFESLREMKALIQRQVQRKGLEHNIKLGRGGIREIEFIGQAFQLIRGGREPALQERGIMKVLPALARMGYLPEFVTRALLDAYMFLRRTENRLQAVADEQVHTVPHDDQGRLRLAFAMGYRSWGEFAADLAGHRDNVHEHFEQVFAAPQADSESERGEAERALAGVWHGALDVNQSGTALVEAGFDEPVEALRLIERLREGHAFRSAGSRGRERLDRLMPMLLGAVGAGDHPAQTLARVINLIEAVAGRTAYLSLLTENPMALSQLVKLCAASPWIALLLTHHPLLLDELLDPRTLYRPLAKDNLRSELRELLAGVDPGDLEQQMEILRHFKQTNTLRVAAADVANVMPLMVVSDHLTAIAEVVLGEVLAIARDNLTRRHGRPVRKVAAGEQPAGFAVIGYGKLGGIELGYGSDLDLVFLHDSDDDGGMTDGAKPIDAAMFFARLGQRMIHVLNTLTPSGVLYDVDMRLRPSGASGLLVSNVEAFAAYQREEAWTWEHQALVRARPVAGDEAVAARFVEIRRRILGRRRDPDILRGEVRDMRERMRAELSKDRRDRFDLKQGRGGIADIEFMVQYAVLRWAHAHPDVAEYTDNIRQLEALARDGLVAAADAQRMSDAYRAYRRRIHQLTLQEEPAVAGADEFPDHRAGISALWRAWMDA